MNGELVLWKRGCIFAMLAVVGCGSSQTPAEDRATSERTRKIAVAAAADLQFAFDELIGLFHNANHDIRVEASFGSSGTFFAQLSNQAPYDLFFSADMQYPRKLIEAGLADKSSERFYAEGLIVIWVRKDSPIDVEKLGIKALIEPDVRKIAIANPRHAPYGRAAEAAMEHFGVLNQVRERLVLGENIAQAAQFVESGAADIGILALSLASAPVYRDQGRFWHVPRDAYPRMEQGCILLRWANEREAAECFLDFVSGPTGREVLRRYGFVLPEE